jgi:hypothetical protein
MLTFYVIGAVFVLISLAALVGPHEHEYES